MTEAALSSDIQVEVIEIGREMHHAKLPNDFVVAAVRTAFEFEGVYDLMKLWMAEGDEDERNAIVADIQEMIDDCAQKEKKEEIYIRFDDLDTIAKGIRVFKDNLRLIVDKKGGIGKLSQLTSIPQPSLSRFFSSASMPRRATLFKIANALELSHVEIATEWSR